MIIRPDFEVVDMAGEYVAVPIGQEAASFNGVVALNEAAAFLLKSMKCHKTKEELVKILMTEYEVDPIVAEKDIDAFLKKMLDMGVIEG